MDPPPASGGACAITRLQYSAGKEVECQMSIGNATSDPAGDGRA